MVDKIASECESERALSVSVHSYDRKKKIKDDARGDAHAKP